MTSEDKLRWVDEIAKHLIHRASRRAPDALSERLGEEWLADMADRASAWSRLRFALGCCWATSVIAHEHGIAALPAARTPAVGTLLGRGYLIGGLPPESPYFSRRALTFLLVAGLHAAVFLALALGFQSTLIKVIPTPIEARFIEHPPTPIDAPKPTGVSLFRPTLDRIAPKKVEVENEPMIPPLVATGEGKSGGGTTEQTQHTINRVEGRPGTGFPSADDYYPSAAIFKGEQGVGTVRACVNAKGILTSEPTITESTGFLALDAAAVRLAKAGSGHYRATTEDGNPVDSCYPFRIRFKLRN